MSAQSITILFSIYDAVLCGGAGGMGTRTNLLVNGSDSDECDSVTGPPVQRHCLSPGHPTAEGLRPVAASPDAFQREFEATLKSGEPGWPSLQTCLFGHFSVLVFVLVEQEVLVILPLSCPLSYAHYHRQGSTCRTPGLPQAPQTSAVLCLLVKAVHEGARLTTQLQARLTTDS